MWRVLFFALPFVVATPRPLEAEPNQEYINLPDSADVTPAFLVPHPENIVSLPVEPKHLLISFGHHSQMLKYFYAKTDTVHDIYKFIAERTKVPLGDIEELNYVTFKDIGRSFVAIPFSMSLKISDVPLAVGDELEVKFKPTVDINTIAVGPVISANSADLIPGFFNVEFKIPGYPQMSIPIPRLATGSLVRTIVEDRLALAMFTVDLHRGQRDGIPLANSEILTDTDNLFFGRLVEREKVGEDGLLEDTCVWGHATVVTNLGKSHFMQYNCNTTAGEALSSMESMGLLPEPSNVYGAGVFVSTKGFFHEVGLDTLKLNQTLVDGGIQENGMVFITVACPVTLVYFQYMQSTFPQYVNCTSTIDYMTSMFWGILETSEAMPEYYFTGTQGDRKQLIHGVPVGKQLEGVAPKIVTIEYPHKPSPSPSPLPAAVSPTPSPSHVDGGVWDATEERNAAPPEGAVPLGEGALLQNAKQRWIVSQTH